MDATETRDERAIRLGHPSYVWRSGQDRRLAMIEEHAPLAGKRVLDVGCGLGAYVARMAPRSEAAYGVDIDEAKIAQALAVSDLVCVSAAEEMPFPGGRFDVVLLNEIIEHVQDDAQSLREASRVLARGGRMIIFCPNRLYPFETHGAYWGGSYHFGNIPFINYLPDAWRDRMAPHVKAYTRRRLRWLCRDLGCRVVVHTQIYPGYDNVAARRPVLAGLLRAFTYLAERTPLRAFGLSHLLVLEKAA